MKKLIFKGSGVALVTPFNDTGVDYEALGTLLDYHLAHKTDALVICGTTGEVSTMAEAEQQAVLRFCIERMKGKMPMIAGTGCNDTVRAIKMSKFAEKIGYDALLLVTPYYNKTTQKGLKKHYGAIAANVGIPLILYNVPSRTGLSISLEALSFLDLSYDNVVAVKEASGDVAFAAKILRETNLAVYSGNDDVLLPILSVGGSGVISVAANIIPEEIHDICADFEAGELERARERFMSALGIMDAMFLEVNPIPIKSAMGLLGFNVGKLRLPLCDMEAEKLNTLKKILEDYGLCLK